MTHISLTCNALYLNTAFSSHLFFLHPGGLSQVYLTSLTLSIETLSIPHLEFMPDTHRDSPQFHTVCKSPHPSRWPLWVSLMHRSGHTASFPFLWVDNGLGAAASIPRAPDPCRKPYKEARIRSQRSTILPSSHACTYATGSHWTTNGSWTPTKFVLIWGSTSWSNAKDIFLLELLANFMMYSPPIPIQKPKTCEYYQTIMSQFTNIVLIVRSIILSALFILTEKK